jgi:hypothetical protein
VTTLLALVDPPQLDIVRTPFYIDPRTESPVKSGLSVP